jgi:hypothetical protein
MPIGRVETLVIAAGSWLAWVAPALAQSGPSSQSDPKAGNSPIVVTAPAKLAPGETPGDWKRAESDHVIVYSDGDEEQLARIAGNLEKLHALLARLYRRPGKDEEPARPVIVLFDSARAMSDLGLRNRRFEEGPYARPFVPQRYYDPRAEGSVLALPRVDQVIDMNTTKARNADCEDMAADGVDCIAKTTRHPAMVRPWEAVLYGAYAQHLVLNYVPAAYPRWYVDGIGALFSTVVFKRDGSVEYGRPPAESYRLVFRAYGLLDTESVLNGEYLHGGAMKMDWTPYHAGLLTHYFVFSDLKDDVRAQFATYMTQIAHGEPMAKAVHAFTLMKKLRYEVMSYAGRDKDFARTARSSPEPSPLITPLSRGAATALMASLAPTP